MQKFWLFAFLLFIGGLVVGPTLLTRQAPADEELTIISPHWDGIRAEFGGAFEAWYKQKTGRSIRVVWRDVGGTGEIRRYLRSRYASIGPNDGVGSDILFGGGMDMLPDMARNNYFTPYRLSPEQEKQLPASVNGQDLRDKNHLYHAACLSSFGFVYNALVIEKARLPQPATWADLGQPAYRGWVSCGDPGSSGSLHAAFELVLQGGAMGEQALTLENYDRAHTPLQWLGILPSFKKEAAEARARGFADGYTTLGRMMSNVRAFNEGGTSIPRDVSLGQAAAGPCIDFYATAPVRRQGAEHLRLVVPEEAALATPDCIAILRSPPNPKAAEAFMEFVLSEAGQRLWYQVRGSHGGPKEYDLERLPVMPSIYKMGLETHTVLNPFEARLRFRYDGRKVGERWDTLNDLWRATVIDVHAELWRARKAVIDAGRDGDLGIALCQPPLTEEQVRQLSVGDAAARRPPYKWWPMDSRNSLKNRWSKWARAWYAQIEQAAASGAPVPAFPPAPTE